MRHEFHEFSVISTAEPMIGGNATEVTTDHGPLTPGLKRVGRVQAQVADRPESSRPERPKLGRRLGYQKP